MGNFIILFQIEKLAFYGKYFICLQYGQKQVSPYMGGIDSHWQSENQTDKSAKENSTIFLSM